MRPQGHACRSIGLEIRRRIAHPGLMTNAKRAAGSRESPGRTLNSAAGDEDGCIPSSRGKRHERRKSLSPAGDNLINVQRSGNPFASDPLDVIMYEQSQVYRQ